MPQKKAFFNFNPNLKIVFLGAFIIIAIGVLFFILGRESFSENKVELSIEGPEEITGGDMVKYRILYKNNSGLDLNQVRLVFTYPEDAVGIKDGLVTELENEIVDMGRLNRGESGELESEAFIVGDRGDTKQAKAVMTFIPSGIQSVIKREAVLSTSITYLPVVMTLVAPPTAVSGQEVTYILDYRNQSGGELRDLRIKIKLPDSFSTITGTPSPSSGQDTWDIDLLADGQGGRISILGVLRGNEREAKAVSAVLQRVIETESGRQYIDFEKAETSTAIASPLLSVSTTVNGIRNYSAGLGDSLTYRVSFKNNTNRSLAGMTLAARLEGVMFDLPTVNTDGFFDSRQNVIIWNASSVPEFGIFEAGAEGSVEFEVRLKRDFPGGVFSAQNSLVKITSTLVTRNVPAEFGLNEIVVEDELVTRISTDTTFNQSLLVSDQSWGSEGPFPPKVDQKTVFTIKWELINPANQVSPAQIRAVLAPGVEWENRSRTNGGSGRPAFNPDTREVIWDLGLLPAGVGSSLPPYEGYFQVSVTPSVNQIGQAPDLLREIEFRGTDTLTKEEIVKTQRNLRTDQAQDRTGGRVE